jgi:hypothetical protein
MQESADVRAALLRFYEAFTQASPGDMESFDRVFTREQGLSVIGTNYQEWVVGREQGTQAWGMEGIGIEAGEPLAWEDGDFAWAIDKPAFVLGDARVPVRLSVVMAREDGAWKIRHGHFSAGVPDDLMIENAAAWSTATPSH